MIIREENKDHVINYKSPVLKEVITETEIANYEWKIFYNIHDICSYANIDQVFIKRYETEQLDFSSNKEIVLALHVKLPKCLAEYINLFANGVYFNPITCVKFLYTHGLLGIYERFAFEHEILARKTLKRFEGFSDLLEAKKAILCEDVYYDLGREWEISDFEDRRDSMEKVEDIEECIGAVEDHMCMIEYCIDNVMGLVNNLQTPDDEDSDIDDF